MSRSVKMNKVFYSSVINGMGYDDKTRTLAVSFNSGHVYNYYDVPRKAWNKMNQGPSAGQAFCATIKGRFSSDRVTD